MSAKDKHKFRIFLVAALAIFVAVLVAGGALRRLSAEKADTKEGLIYLEQAQTADCKIVRHKIKALEEKNREESGEENTKSIMGTDAQVLFEDSVVMGDSIPEALLYFDDLYPCSVTAKAGRSMESQIREIGALNPETIFISWGTDVITSGSQDMDEWMKTYVSFLDSIVLSAPDSRIFVNSIFPLRIDVAEKIPEGKNLSLYNEKLQKLCDKRNIAFIDNADLEIEEFYEDDGIHLKAGFYPAWLQKMAKAADLRR